MSHVIVAKKNWYWDFDLFNDGLSLKQLSPYESHALKKILHVCFSRTCFFYYTIHELVLNSADSSG